jgi:hypothetical protein
MLISCGSSSFEFDCAVVKSIAILQGQPKDGSIGLPFFRPSSLPRLSDCQELKRFCRKKDSFLPQDVQQNLYSKVGSYHQARRASHRKTIEKPHKMAINHNQASPPTTPIILDNRPGLTVLRLYRKSDISLRNQR